MNDWVNEDDTPYIRMKAERDELIDDLSWYKAKVSRLEREKDDMLLEREYYKNRYEDMTRICKELEREIKEFDKNYEMVTNNCIYWEDKAHWLEGESSKCINLLSEFSQHIGNKPSSGTYKYFRAKLDNLGIGERE